MKNLLNKKLFIPLLSIFMVVSCSSTPKEMSNSIKLINFNEKEDDVGEVGEYYKYNKYLSVIDNNDHTYLGKLEKVISPSNNEINGYNDKIHLEEIGLYRLYFNYPLTSKDTRYKVIYLDSRDTKAPEVFFKETPNGYLGVEYTLPTAITNDESHLPVNLSYELYLLNDLGAGKTLIDCSKTFTPTVVGTYSYEALATDCYNNKAKASIEFNVSTNKPLIHDEIDASNYSKLVKVSHTGGGTNKIEYDEENSSVKFNAASLDNFYINANKSIDLENYDIIRIKTKCNNDITNAYTMAELDGVGKGNSFAYFTRNYKDGFTYFEMSIEKFLPYWKHVSFNHAIIIFLCNKTTPIEFYDIELAKTADIRFESSLTTKVNEEYEISVSCPEAVGSSFTYKVIDPLDKEVEVIDNKFIPTAIGRYVITSTINHFFYEGEKSVSIDVISDKEIEIEEFELPKLNDTFTLPKANLDGDETGFNIEVTRNGLVYPISDNKIEIKNNGKYVIAYTKTVNNITYSKRANVNVGVTYLNEFSSLSDVSYAYGSQTNHVKTSYKQEFAGEKGVVSFEYQQTRWPNLFFSCPNLSEINMDEYSYISFNMYLPDSLMNLNARYGKNNEEQDLTYYENKQGVTSNTWSTYSYSTDLFFDFNRYNDKLPLQLIGVERSEDASLINSAIYISDIYLTKKEDNTVVDFESISGVKTQNVESISYLDNYENEHSVIKFSTTKTYPQLFFNYGNLSQYDINAYDFINFRMWIDDCYDGLFMRKGENNSVDVATYHKVVRSFSYNNFTTGQWVNFYYPISAFINDTREGNPLMLISLRNESLTTTGNIYISKITLEKNKTDQLTNFASTVECIPDGNSKVSSIPSFNGENDVCEFTLTGSYPNLKFNYQCIDTSLTLGYTKLIFKAYFTEDIRGVVLRYGANNSVDDGTYNRWTIGQIPLNTWTTLEYPIDRFVNSDRKDNPLLLIFQKETSKETKAYFSSIYLAK